MVTGRRIERFKKVREDVERDIRKYMTLEMENRQLSEIVAKLDIIDNRFFRDKLIMFNKHQQLEKPYLDSDGDTIAISEDAIQQMKFFLSELSNIEPNEFDDETSEVQDVRGTEQKIFNPDNMKYREELNSIIAWLNLKIKHYNENETRHPDIIESVSMANVQQIRNRNPISFQEFRENVKTTFTDIDTKRAKTMRSIEHSKILRSIKIWLPILIIAIFGCALAIALMLFL